MRNKKKLPLIAAAGICALSLMAMVCALLLTGRNSGYAFTPPPFEAEAVAGIPDVPEELGWSELDAQVYRAFLCGVVIVENGRADLWFTNPAENEAWLKLRVLDEHGNILGETGLLRPGEYVRSIRFDKIPEKGQRISLKLMGYEPDTYHSAGSVTLNTRIEGVISQ